MGRSILTICSIPTPVSIPAPVSIPTLAIHTYQRKPHQPPTPHSCTTLTDSQPSHPTQQLPTALRKDKSSQSPNPIFADHLDYHRFSTSYSTFVVSLDSVSISKTTGEAMSDLEW